MPSVGRPICSGHSSLDSLRKRQRPLHFQPCCTFAFEDLTHRASVMVSWHRSQPLDETDPFEDESFDWTPSELAREERRLIDERSDGTPSEVDPREPTEVAARWRCLVCRSAAWSWDYEMGFYKCSQCGSCDFYDENRPTKLETLSGTWMYVPHSPSSAGSGDCSGDAGRDISA